MVREKNVEKFHRYFADLWAFIKKLSSEDVSAKKYLNKLYLKHRDTDKIVYLEKVLDNISPYIDYINKKDEFIFTPEFGNKPLNFIVGYDFRILWKKDLSSEQKRIIFRYLEFLYIQASIAKGINQEKVNQIVESIKTEQDIERAVTNNPNLFGDDQSATGSDFKSLFGDDNILVDLAQDISSEFDLQGSFSSILGNSLKPGQNPLEAIQNLSQNPEIRQMMEKMTTRVVERMKEKNITQDDLLKSAETLKDNLSANVAKMPGGAHLRRMINNLNMEQFASQFSNQNEVVNIGDTPPTDPNAMMAQMLNNFGQLATQSQQNDSQQVANTTASFSPAANIPTSSEQLPPELLQLMQQLQAAQAKK